MSKLKTRHIFTSESVGEGHPDKVCDQISDAILDECLKHDENAHVACETAVGKDFCANIGEITCAGFEDVNPEQIARKVVKEIGYANPDEGFDAATFEYVNRLHGQSPDIAQGVNRKRKTMQGAGDQGMMFGYASNETKELMPAPIMWSHGMLAKFAKMRRNGTMPFLRPDSKGQVSVVYENGKPVAIDTVVLSHQTTEDGANAKCYAEMEEAARAFLSKTKMLTNGTKFYVNPTGKFVVGGPCGDSGLTGRKIICDTYGGVGSHGGGAFSGKDPSKVDRSAAYYARYVAKNIVAAGLAQKCEVQVAYAIGVAHPMSVNVCTFGMGRYSDEWLQQVVQKSGLFDFCPGVFIEKMGLKNPQGWCYRKTANYGHFGNPAFPWEHTDKVEQLKEAARH